MGIIKSLDFMNHQFNPFDAHREGSLSYYIWAGAAFVLRGLGILKTGTHYITDYTSGYQDILFMGRLISISFDVAATGLIYMILTRIIENKNAALWGTLVFALIPFEVIQSHFMRPHTMANFFVLMAIYFSTFILKPRAGTKYLFLKIGLCCGLATATRYPSVVVLLVPFLLLAFEGTTDSAQKRLIPFIKKASTVGFFWIFGFFIVDPFLFLKFNSATHALTEQASYANSNQFGTVASLLDMSKPWGYLKWIIPYGLFPFLWVLIYGAMIYLCFAKKWWKWSLALFIPMFVNFIAMAKGYPGPEFVRAIIFLFPFFAIICGLAIDDFSERWRSHPWIYPSALTLISLIIGSTLIFDWSYVYAMNEANDSRIALYNYLSHELGQRKNVPVGMSNNSAPNYFISGPTLEVLKTAGTISLQTQDPEAYLSGRIEPEYIVLGGLTGNPRSIRDEVVNFEKTRRYALVKVFEPVPEVFGWKFDYNDIPEDMRYPFPKIYLLKAASLAL